MIIQPDNQSPVISLFGQRRPIYHNICTKILSIDSIQGLQSASLLEAAMADRQEVVHAWPSVSRRVPFQSH